ncbi:hypothetical protein [Marinicellulosiphila megalodicopiae]|uniref:hypothetical protein n=1 Tax=Marinicellulosiphila megalodicopiae TaxID=2724896 RepID=UPI003BB0C1FF
MKAVLSMTAILLCSNMALAADLVTSSKSSGTTRCFWDTTGDGNWDTITKTRSGMGKSSEDCDKSTNKPANSILIDSDTVYTAEAAQEEKTKVMAP